MKRPFAYVTAPWTGSACQNSEKALRYCRQVYDAGYTPICPLLLLTPILNDRVPQEHKDGLDMSRDLLRRSHVLVVCGDTVTEAKRYRHRRAAAHHRHHPGRHSDREGPGPELREEVTAGGWPEGA